MHVSGFTYKVVGGQDGDPELYESLFRLRYQVYVNEWGFEKPEDHPDGLEKDQHDQYSRHFYALAGEDNQIVGTARIIQPSDLILPIKEYFSFYETCEEIPKQSAVEISRLAISKDFRRRAIDNVIFNQGKTHDDDLNLHQKELEEIKVERRKCEHELIRGIYLSIYRECLTLGYTHCYAVMARGLYVILARWGICFNQIGPEIKYHGIRAPYVLSIKEFEETLERKNPELLRLAREGVEQI